MIRTTIFGATLALVLILGCGGGLIGCGGLEGHIKDLAEDNIYELGAPILRIYEVTEVSRTETRVECTGRAKLRNGNSLYISYYSYVDRDGDSFIGFEVLR